MSSADARPSTYSLDRCLARVWIIVMRSEADPVRRRDQCEPLVRDPNEFDLFELAPIPFIVVRGTIGTSEAFDEFPVSPLCSISSSSYPLLVTPLLWTLDLDVSLVADTLRRSADRISRLSSDSMSLR